MIEDRVWIVEWVDPPYDHEIEKIFQSELEAKEYIESQPKKVQKSVSIIEFKVEPSRDLDTQHKALIAQAVSMCYSSGVEASNHHAQLMQRKSERLAHLKPRPTIAELEAILNSEDQMDIEILPNGEVRAIPHAAPPEPNGR